MKVARRRRDERRESNKHQTFVISPSVIFLRKTTVPSSEGACVGQTQGLSLRYDIEFNLTATVNNYGFVSFLGGSKPPPYAVGRKFTFTDSRKGCLYGTILNSI